MAVHPASQNCPIDNKFVLILVKACAVLACMGNSGKIGICPLDFDEKKVPSGCRTLTGMRFPLFFTMWSFK